MFRSFDYTSFARRFTARFPRGSYIGIQITFWVIANNIMALISHLHYQLVTFATGKKPFEDVVPVFVLATILGVVYGGTLGWIGYLFESAETRAKSFMNTLLTRFSFSALLGLVVFATLTYLYANNSSFLKLPALAVAFQKDTRGYSFCIFMLFYGLMNLLIGFINLINKRFGTGVLIPLIMGRYARPIEEERVFMFMDLRSSTTIAEQLGHISYSDFIRQCFWDIDHVLKNYQAEIYQYVGDGIILTWRADAVRHHPEFLEFYFGCESMFKSRSDYYTGKYGTSPQFKTGIHIGMVTAVEIGDQKREIAYHGDTINTASRIQELCSSSGENVLVSKIVLDKVNLSSNYLVKNLGHYNFKGKHSQIEVFGIGCC